MLSIQAKENQTSKGPKELIASHKTSRLGEGSGHAHQEPGSLQISWDCLFLGIDFIRKLQIQVSPELQLPGNEEEITIPWDTFSEVRLPFERPQDYCLFCPIGPVLGHRHKTKSTTDK